MKAIYLILFVFGSLISTAQINPVRCELRNEKINDSIYKIHALIKVADGWSVYANDEIVTEVEPISLKWDNEKIQKTGDHSFGIDPENMYDSIFQKSFKKFLFNFTITQEIKVTGTPPPSLTIAISGYASKNFEFLPIALYDEIVFEGVKKNNAAIKINSIDIDHPVSSCGDKQETNSSLMFLFFIGFGGGLLALLTPCISADVGLPLLIYTYDNIIKAP